MGNGITPGDPDQSSLNPAIAWRLICRLMDDPPQRGAYLVQLKFKSPFLMMVPLLVLWMVGARLIGTIALFGNPSVLPALGSMRADQVLLSRSQAVASRLICRLIGGPQRQEESQVPLTLVSDFPMTQLWMPPWSALVVFNGQMARPGRNKHCLILRSCWIYIQRRSFW